ncbi:MAG: transglycosylase domain-containing protein [Anaerosomatales bacterium]|nr:transglycosylase domain-containing protein [Anaerosomatales bacterium]
MPVSKRLMRILTVLAAVLAVWTVLLLAASYYLYRLSLTLPDFRGADVAYQMPRTSIVYAADGSVLADWHGEQDRTIVEVASLPRVLKDAVVAAEDERFYEHQGVDLGAVIRAARHEPGNDGLPQGASTITQQLVKLLFTDGERTIVRRLEEMLLAYQLEAESDKDALMETYLNVVYFGHGAYGVESAAQRYFGVPASRLDLPQAALLAGVIRSPGRFSPHTEPAFALERRNTVLGRMRDLGLISVGEARDAIDSPVEVRSPEELPRRAPHFVEWVKRDLIEQLGSEVVYGGGLRVYTTLDPAVQSSAERAVQQVLGAEDDPETAMVTLEPATGRVLAMMGGRDFAEDQYNLATQGRRQTGSAFKTFVLVRALEENISPSQMFDTSPYSVAVKDGIWKVQNYDGTTPSPRVSLLAATKWSVNTVYARLIMKVGPEDVVDVARRMGITSPLEPNPAIALGGLSEGVTPLEMASAYGTIAAKGERRAPHGVDVVLDDRGETIWEPEITAEQAISGAVAGTASSILREVVDGGTGLEADFGQWAAGKTGTSQSHRDAWFVGWSGDLCTAVWVGYRDGDVAMLDVRGIRVTGGSFPALIWKDHMARTYGKPRPDYAARVLSQGEDTRTLVSVCRESQELAGPRCTDIEQVLVRTQEVPAEACSLH